MESNRMSAPPVVSPATVLPPVSSPPAWRNLFKIPSQMKQGEVPFLIKGFLPEGITFVGALPGVGKTWFALSLCKSLVTGQPFLRTFEVPSRVPVLYMVPECGERPFRARLDLMGIPSDGFFVRTLSDGMPLRLGDPLLLAAV